MSRASIRSILSRNRSWVLSLIGILLLLNPFIVGSTDFGDPDRYRYEPAKVAERDGTVDVPPGVDIQESEVVCLHSPPTRACMLERAILKQQGLVYDGLPRRVLTADYGYVYDEVNGTDRFYRPVTEETADGRINYTHEEIPSREVLERISTPIQDAAPGIRDAITTGSHVTSDPLAAAETLIRTEDGYYVVHATEMYETTGERRFIVQALQWIAGILAIGMIYGAG
ncbi:MAG: hypothetical protein ABEJ48_08125, partial [Halobacteriales archaeon]